MGCQTDNSMYYQSAYETEKTSREFMSEVYAKEIKECRAKIGPDIRIELPAIVKMDGNGQTMMNSVLIGGVSDEQMEQIKKVVMEIATHPERYKKEEEKK